MKQSLLTSLVTNIRQGISTFNTRCGQLLHGCFPTLEQQNGITFSRLSLTRCALLVALILGSVNVWGQETVTYTYTYTFTAKEWTSTNGNWTYSAAGSAKANAGVTPAINSTLVICSPVSYGKIVSVQVQGTCNKSASGDYTIYKSANSGTTITGTDEQIGTKSYSSSSSLTTAIDDTHNNASGGGYVKLQIHNASTTASKWFYIKSVTITYETAPAVDRTVTWSVNGDETTSTVTDGEKPVYNGGTDPTTSNCDGTKVFVGWTTDAITTATDTKPNPLYSTTELPTVTENKTYYAVFATEETGGSTSTETTATLSFAGGSGTNLDPISFSDDASGISAVFTAGNHQTKPRWDASCVRFYGTSTATNNLTISGATITKIVFTMNGSYKLTAVSANTGTIDTETNTWTGSATSVVFTTTAQTRFEGISVTYAGSGGGSTTKHSGYVTTCSEPTCSTPTTISFGLGENVNKFFGDAAFTNTITTNNTAGEKTYRSSHTDVATIDASGEVTIVGKGQTTITVSIAESGDYCSKTATYTLNVACATLATPSNLGTSALDKTTATLTWDAVPNATGYTVVINGDTYTPTTESCEVTGLTEGTEYSWTVKATSTNDNYCESAVATGSIATKPLDTYTITWLVSGSAAGGEPTTSVTEGGSGITALPAEPGKSACDGLKEFVGWSASEISGTTNTEPSDLFTTADGAPAISDNTTFYAVFANASINSGSTTDTYDWEVATTGNWTVSKDITRTDKEGNGGGYAGGISTNNTYVTYKNKVKVTAFSFDFKRTSTNENYNVYIETSADGSTWTAAATYAMSSFGNGSYTHQEQTFDGTQELYVRFHCYQTTAKRYVDNVSITYTGAITYSGYVTTCTPLDESKWHNVTVNVSPASATGCTATAGDARVYDTGTTSLTATVGSGYTFAGWSVTNGTATIADPTALTTTLQEITSTDVTVTANFVEGEWELVTDANFLQAGDRLVLADNAHTPYSVAGALTNEGKGLQRTAASFSEDKSKITYFPATTNVLTLGGDYDAWTLKNSAGALLGVWTGDKYMNFEAAGRNTTWTINIASNNEATIASGTSTIYHLFAANGFSAMNTTGDMYYLPQLYYKKIAEPRIIVNKQSLSGFTYPEGKGPSALVESFTVTGMYIAEDASVVVYASEGWEVCKTANGTFASSVNLSQAEVEGKTVTIYVRMAEGLGAIDQQPTPQTGTIEVGSTDDAVTRTIDLAGTVTPTYLVTWKSEGEIIATEYVEYEKKATPPANPIPQGNCVGKVFMGWTDTEITGNQASAPTDLFTHQPTIVEEVTFYAVFADRTEASGTSNIYTPVTTAPEDWSGNYVIVNSAKTYAMTSGMTNSGEFDTQALTIYLQTGDKIKAPTDAMIWTLSKKEGTDSYYMQNVGTGTYAKITGTDSKNAALTDTPDDSFTITAASTGVWKVASTTNTLRIFSPYNSSNPPTFRTYSQSNNTTGYLYKQEVNYTYSAYSTSCPCDEPETPLAIAGEPSGTLPTDGSAFTKTFTIEAGSGNGSEKPIKWSVEQSTATIDEATGAFSTTTSGWYTIKATQPRNGDYCMQIAVIMFEVQAPDVTYTVTFMDDQKIVSTQSVQWGEVVAPPVSPMSCPASMFVGWTTDASIPDPSVSPTLFDFTTPIIGNSLTLRAVYDTGECENTYTKKTSTPDEYDAEYILASPDGTYGIMGVVINGQLNVMKIGDTTNPTQIGSTDQHPDEHLIWQITKHAGTGYYRVFNRNTHNYLSIAADGTISLSSTPADVKLDFKAEDNTLHIYNTTETYGLTWGSNYARPLSTESTYDGQQYYWVSQAFTLYERDCKDASYTFVNQCCENYPTNITYSSTANTITISWDCPVDNADLRIYTADAQEITDKAATGVTGKTYTFKGLTNKTDYFIRIWGGGDCAGELTHVVTTDATVDIIDWGQYGDKVGVTINLNDENSAQVSFATQEVHGEQNIAKGVFFSKYFEATGNLKLLGLYNGTGATVDLSGHSIRITNAKSNSGTCSTNKSDSEDHSFFEAGSEVDVITFGEDGIPTLINDGEEWIFYAYKKTDEDKTVNGGGSLLDCINDKLKNTFKDNITWENRENWYKATQMEFGGRSAVALFNNADKTKPIDIIGAWRVSNNEAWSDGSEIECCANNNYGGDANGWIAEGVDTLGQPLLLSTNRCLLIRKNSVKSGENAVTQNKVGFNTLGTEWMGTQVLGTSSNNATNQEVCDAFSSVAVFNYRNYHLTYNEPNKQDIAGNMNPDGTYTIPVDDIYDLACTMIKIETFAAGETTPLVSTEVKVPIIVHDSQNTNGEAFKKLETDLKLTNGTDAIANVCKNCDVVVKNSAVLTHNNTAPQFTQIRDLYIYPGATVKIAEGTYNINSITLRSEADNVPHVILPTGGELDTRKNNIRFTKRILNDRFYFFSVPFTCQVSDIRLSNGLGEYGVDFVIVEYDGKRRSEKGSDGGNWATVPADGELVPGKGYNIAVSSERKTEVVFPMTITNTALHESDNQSYAFDVHAHGINADGTSATGHAPNNLGWNLVAHPYFTTYQAITDANHTENENVKVGMLELNSDKEYEWTNTGYIYVTQPEITASNIVATYTQSLAHNQELLPFHAFFVQAGTSGTLDFVHSKIARPELAARRASAAADDNQPVFVGVSLTNGQKTDETSLVINNRYTQAYEIGADLEKMLGFADKPQVYIKDNAYQYAFKALNEQDAANANMLGVYLPAKQTTTYTFELMRNYDLSRVQGVYLTDHVVGTTINLMQSEYTFTSGYAYTNSRFSLSVVLAPKIATQLTQTAIGWSVWQDAPLHINLQGLNIGDKVRVIDATGKLVHQTIVTDSRTAFDLPSIGAYCVQAIGKEGLQVKKVVVK